MAQTIQQIGVRLDLVGRKGSVLGVYRAAVVDETNVAVALTGVTPSGSVKDAAGNVIGAVTFDTSLMASGIVRYWIEAAVTNQLSQQLLDEPALFTYETTLAWPDGGPVKPFIYGELRIIEGTGA